MDQAVAVHALAGRCLRLDCHTFEAVQLPLRLSGVGSGVDAATGLALVVVNTNAPHRLVDSEYADRRAAVEHATALLGVPALGTLDSVEAAWAGLAEAGSRDPVLRKRVRHVITESARARAAAELLAADRVAELGPLLDASHTCCGTTTRSAAPSWRARWRRPSWPVLWVRGWSAAVSAARSSRWWPARRCRRGHRDTRGRRETRTHRAELPDRRAVVGRRALVTGEDGAGSVTSNSAVVPITARRVPSGSTASPR